MISWPYGRPGQMTMVVVEVMPDDYLRLRAETSQVRRSALPERDYQIPVEELEVVAKINRLHITSGSPSYQQLDPMAIYAPGDRVCVVEVYDIHQPARMAPNLETQADIDRFILDPETFYEKGPEQAKFEAKHFVLGAWRTTPLPDPPTSFSLNPFGISLNELT